jgi:hypothetical protein
MHNLCTIRIAKHTHLKLHLFVNDVKKVLLERERETLDAVPKPRV